MTGADPLDLSGRAVLVAGAGRSGAAAARALRDRGARVRVAEADPSRAGALAAQGFDVADLAVPPRGTTLVVTSPGWRPDSPLLRAAGSIDGAGGIEVIGEVELAWRLRDPAVPWLAVTGTNGKTTTVRMLEAVLRAAGHRAVAAGNVGLPVVEALAGDAEVLAVELSSFQLHWSSTLHPAAGALLNVADDHTDWHGSFAAYAQAKARVLAADVAVANADDQVSRALLDSAPGRRVTFTLGPPRAGQLGVVEGLLLDRAFSCDGPDVPGEATELAEVGDLPLPAPHAVADALAAAALARAYGVPADAVRAGLRAFRPEPHRAAPVGTVDTVAWVDDSKATNPHAAAASLSAYPAGVPSVVWVAGGLLKGAAVDDLVRLAAPRLRAAVLLGRDRHLLAQSLARHAPQVPVVEVDRLDTGAMPLVVRAAHRLAQPGDTVLLAPAAASMDCFRDYAERGALFAAAVRELAAGEGA